MLDTWSKNSSKSIKARRPASQRPPAGSWRSTPYASQPGSAADVTDASSAAARSFYSLMNNGSNGSGLASPTDSISDPVHSHQPDPNVMQLWTDKPRFGATPYGAQEHQQHHDPWRQQQQEQAQQQAPRIFVPPPPSGASTEEYARWQALQSVMAALQHSSGEQEGGEKVLCVCVCTLGAGEDWQLAVGQWMCIRKLAMPLHVPLLLCLCPQPALLLLLIVVVHSAVAAAARSCFSHNRVGPLGG